MTIYIPLLYICIGLECAFFQSEIYTLDEKKCEQEIAQQKSELVKQGKTVQAICVDVKILENKSNVANRSLTSW
jgi:hypothetical protein